MTHNIKEPIPAILVHTEGRDEYRIHGKIVGINESASTVSMTINGREGVEHGIPMGNVYLTEGIIDSLKKAGKAIVNSIKSLIRKVKGFLLPVIDGEPDYRFINLPVNVCAMEARGELPGCVHFYPNGAVEEMAEENDIEIANVGIEPGAHAAADETSMIERYWARVMRTYVKNESYNISDAVKAVNEEYVQHSNKRYAAMNEAVVSMRNPAINRSKYGEEVGTDQLIDLCVDNITQMLDREIGEPIPNKPIIIWGAPGIGKTSIIKGITGMLKEGLGLDLLFSVVQCANLQRDDWALPAVSNYMTDGIQDQKFSASIPKTWLPVYLRSGNEERDTEVDAVFNSALNRPGNTHKYDGGVLFFDEFARLPMSAKNIMMALVDQAMYENMTLASKWAIIFASNRFEDTANPDDRAIFEWEMAQDDRFLSVTYVPTKAEWLNWARGINSETGRQNVDEKYCAFIEMTSDGVWYDALDMGSRDNVLTPDEKNIIKSYDDVEAAVAVLHDNEKLAGSKQTWTPRSWTKAAEAEQSKLKSIFRNHPELLKDIYVDGNVNSAKLEKALNMLSDKEWNFVFGRFIKQVDPKGRMSRMNVYNTWVFENIIKLNFGKDNLPAQEWENYTAYKSVFTPDVLESIWLNGKLPDPKMQADDDKYFQSLGDYGSTEFSRWKSYMNLANEVIDMIFNAYPGGIKGAAAQVKKEAPLADAPGNDDAAVTKARFAKYQKMFTVKIGKDNVPTLFADAKEASNYRGQRILHTLEVSEFARNLAQVASWIAKVAIQTGLTVLLQNALGYINFMGGKFIEQFSTADPAAHEALSKTQELCKIISDKTATEKATCNMLIFPAVYILKQAQTRNVRYAQQGHF